MVVVGAAERGEGKRWGRRGGGRQVSYRRIYGMEIGEEGSGGMKGRENEKKNKLIKHGRNKQYNKKVKVDRARK